MEIFWFLLLALLGGLGGLIVFIYYLKKGAFEDPEDPKYQMFREEEDAEIPK
ncbi:cbb3-type cytochrome oxidase assembly protein CcoS [Chlamydiota bacterium]